MFSAATKTDNVSSAANYIEDVFSTYLYTGTGSSQTITNGIDLSGKGGLVWLKSRNNPDSHYIVDTARGSNKVIYSNLTIAEETLTRFSSFNSNGFSLSTTPSNPNVNGYTYASWTFRKQAKFFDVVTYTGNNASNRAISHNLGSTPGFILVKATSTTGDWYALHRVGNSGSWGVGTLNSTGTFSAPNPSFWGNGTTFTAPTSTTFTVSADGGSLTNGSGITFVAYLFAHDAGGFGATGTDNVISCGSFTTDGGSSFTAVNLGYEPQWLLIKASSGTSNWTIVDNMRGIPVGSNGARLIANLSDAETSTFSWANLTATGFGPPTGGTNPYSPSTTYIYIAIRRGPMKTPTSGTSVFSPVAYTGNGSNNRAITTGFVPDMVWWKSRSNGTDWKDATLLIGTGRALTQNTTDAEGSVAGYYINTYNNTGFTYGTSDSSYNTNTWTYVVEGFSRAPGFFDVVCYTGAGSATTFNHNLTVVPELMIVKSRSRSPSNWAVYSSALGNTKYLLLESTAASATETWWNNTTPTSSVFSVDNAPSVNASGSTYVAYLFATVAGVSKVGSYTGTGALQTINCGFAAGARFVLIKRTDSTGDWYVYDSARGITSGNDPYLFLNSTAAEVTNTNYVDTASTGFQVTAAAPAGLNANGGTYIFLAIS